MSFETMLEITKDIRDNIIKSLIKLILNIKGRLVAVTELFAY